MKAELQSGAVFRGILTPRYTDQDTWRHVNNSRAYQLHIEARVQALVHRFGPNAWFSDVERLRPLRTITQFREMSFYGSNVQFVVTVRGVDRDRVQVRTELSQNNQLVGIQDVWLGALLDYQPVALPDDVFGSFRADVPADPSAMPDDAYSQYAKDFSRFAVHRELTPRYADLDADSQRSEAAIARYMEQARSGVLRGIDMGGLSILVAAMDITYRHYRPSLTPVQLVTGVSHVGNTSYHLTGGAQSCHGIHAIANSVMVAVNPETNRPAPITDNIRDQMEKLRL
ncbi:MAG: hypothetical protein ACTHWH_09645 [Marinobacter sp.]